MRSRKDRKEAKCSVRREKLADVDGREATIPSGSDCDCGSRGQASPSASSRQQPSF